MNYLPQFKIWLQSRNYSLSTIRNYLADISRYQEFAIKQSHDFPTPDGRSDNFQERNHVSEAQRVSTVKIVASPEYSEHQQKSIASLQSIFDPELLKSYILSLKSDPNYRRYLSSLNKFCQFALDQQLITSNPIKHILRQLQSPPKTDLDNLLKRYQTYLTKKNKTPVTIRNYINDIQQYINFFNN